MPWAARSGLRRRSATGDRLCAVTPEQPGAVARGRGRGLRRRAGEGFEGCDHDCHKTVNKNHGRIEARRCLALGTPEYTWYAAPNKTWPDLHNLVMIEAQRRQGKQVVSETCCYISGLPADARALLQAVRSHWGC